MIENVQVEVEPRSETGKNHNRRLRSSGRIPGIVYGMDRPAVSVAVLARRIEEVLRLETGRNTIFNLVLNGDEKKKRAVMIREIQRDPVTENMVHLDFVRVDLTKPVHVNVPVNLVGTPEGVKNEGGVIDFVNRVVEIECLPADIPDKLDVDVSELHIGQNVSVSDIAADEKIKFLTDTDSILAVVMAPRVEVEAAPTEEEEAAAEGAEAAASEERKEAEPTGEAEAKSE
jgi:large subunit ribosomal protein L25